ncbi:MAG TPA: nucleotidyltransferase domain-containing protein [Planctomycetota bacterium]|nr:nucleotidyltransferase domain-containing protein [Planctomycetota bacterium]
MSTEAINASALAAGKKALAPGVIPGKFPERFVFVTISGAHLYGFPSPDSDVDLRGAHVLDAVEALGLHAPNETFESSSAVVDGIEVDCVSHDLRKYLLLLTKKNGYVLEQIFSPLVVFDSGQLGELRMLARGAMTRHVVHHYLGFFATEERLVRKAERPTAKSVLYLFRVVMTGLHLLRTGEVECNVLRLNDEHFKLPYIRDLVQLKMAGTEKGVLESAQLERFLADAKTLEAQLKPAADNSILPDAVQNMRALNDFLIRNRLVTLTGKS